ncbi:hypothetical protein ABIF44_003714 [Bradyrhizobium japonicum]|nr:hypothetical protein [Bradyrhizobium japonicum]MCS3989984.1 hypothetical protein [Bradyrhizobium japonicum]MCS4015203.1 hypothetical protein [Bradyrhizobium japonicum]MCS4202297.1 hypothetical protein [Bradyrhizobium japonicum]MDH6174567.1 hypothetical protein [Bradyrhizobium japonicum]
MDDDDLAVEDGLALQLERACDAREPLGPVMTVASEDFRSAAVHMHLRSVAVVFDFVNPLGT